jgi:hypothetical protein
MDKRTLDDAIIQTAQAEVAEPMVRRAERAERNSLRSLRAAVAIAILGMLLSFLWNGWNSGQIAQNEAQYAITQEGLDSLKAANERLEERGLPQIPLPREGEALDADAIAAAAAAILKDDISEDPTFRGPKGDSCDPEEVGCQGPSGPSGQPGAPGESGDTGQPGSVGERGPQGRGIDTLVIDQGTGELWVFYDDDTSQNLGRVVGRDGQDGTNGNDGLPGPLCPGGYTAMPREAPLSSVGETWYVCTDSQG